MGVLTRIKLCMCISVWALDCKVCVREVIYPIWSRQPSKFSVCTHQNINKHMWNQFSERLSGAASKTSSLHYVGPWALMQQSTGDNSFWHSKDILFKMNFWVFLKRKLLNCTEKWQFIRNIFTLLFFASHSLECRAENMRKTDYPIASVLKEQGKNEH